MMNNFGLGILSMLISSLCVAMMCFLGQALSESLALSLLVFIRFFCPFLLAFWMLVTLDSYRFHIQPPFYLHALRALFVVAGQYCLFYALHHHSVLMATLLFSTAPLFAPIITAMVHKTPIDLKIWPSLILGFIGITCVLHPGLKGIWNMGLLVGLGSGFFNACCQVTFQNVSKDHSPLSELFYMFGLSALITAGPMLVSWYHYRIEHEFSYLLDSDLLLILILFSLISMSNQMFRFKAYQYAQPIYMAPFWYASIPMSAMLDWYFKGHIPDILTVIGSCCVIVGGVLMVRYKKQTSKAMPIDHQTALSKA